MASNYRTKQKKQLILALVCCVLVFAMLAATIIISAVHKASLYTDFEDKDFATAIATALGLSSKYDLTAEDLNRFEGLIYYCSVGVDSSTATPYAYPVVMLCDKTYTDVLMEQNDPDYEGTDTSNTDYSKNIVQVPYLLTNPADLNLFPNLRMLRAFDLNEVNSMAQGCQMTQMYQMYGMTQQSYDLTTVVNASKMDDFTSLSQIASLTKLEQLSICYTGVTSLDGIENFPNLNKLDATYTLINDITALESAKNLTFLSLNSVNVAPAADEDEEHDHDHSEDASSAESSADESSKDETSADEKEEEEEEKEEVVYNTTGLTNEDMAIIAKLPKLKYLDIANNNVSDLSALSALSNVKYLSVAQNPVTSLAGIENMTNLELIHALDCKLTNIDALTGFEKLETVILSNNSITSLAPLASATLVTSLDASENELTNIDPVSNMTKLMSLTLNDNKLTSLPDLSKLDRLGSLDISSNMLTDVSGLEKFDPQYPGMTDEEVEEAKKKEEEAKKEEKPKDEDKVEEGKKEEETEEEEGNTITINLSDNRIPYISLSATKLGSLDLSENKLLVTEDRDSALVFNGCDKLTSLTLTKNDKLTSLKGIETLTGLTTLNASESAIEIIPELKELKSLATVNLSKTNITNINGLKDNESITTLTLSECEKLTDISVLNTLKKLTTVHMGKCVELTDESITAAFGTPKTGDKEAELKFDKTTKLTVTITGCPKITNYDIFDAYGNMKVEHDTTTKK